MENNKALYNRIRKNQKQLKSFLAQQQISCYRIYDWDMPEYPLCVDVYEDKLHVSMYQTRYSREAESDQLWQQHCIDTLQELFGIREEDIYIKSRTRKKTTGQYEKVNETNTFFTVNENGIQFLVNLSDYVDTGLFLDHRNTRKRVMSEAKGKHVLNLFAYTGSFSVYAAMGNAFTTTTLDLSGTYLNWAKENFKLNQIPLSKHQFIQTDAKEWVKQAPARLYDIIILDPPTISTSEKTKTNFDVQTDHAELINNTLNHLQPGGILYFSNNFRNFVLDAEKIRSAIIEDISQQSVPLDFRNKKIHACWRIVKI